MKPMKESILELLTELRIRLEDAEKMLVAARSVFSHLEQILGSELED